MPVAAGREADGVRLTFAPRRIQCERNLDPWDGQVDAAHSIEARNERASWRRGLSQVAPIVLGYVPIGFAYGVLAEKAGLSPRSAVLMSALVYAGASQFIATGLLAAGALPLSIVVTTFVVNLRHALMSASLAPHLRSWRPPALAAFAYQLTDETFAVHATRFRQGTPGKSEAFCVNACAQLAWIMGSWLGVLGGQFVPDPRPWGLDYALPALFLALLVSQVQDRIDVGVALAAGIIAVGLTWAGLDHWSVVLATCAGATVGAIWETWTKRRLS
jgi:4-azaleucine resistance transporter AzlC